MLHFIYNLLAFIGGAAVITFLYQFVMVIVAVHELNKGAKPTVDLTKESE